MSANAPAQAGSSRRLTTALVVVTSIFLLAVAVVYAFNTSFSYFAAYDDEGFMLMTVRGYFEGHRLYSDIFTYYGPYYYVHEWLAHSISGLPLTNDASRFLCIAHWLIACTAFATAAGLWARSVVVGFLVFCQSLLHLTALAREPGHPQELVAVLLGLACLAAVKDVKSRWTLPLLGAIGGALATTKINVGAFYVLALITALVSTMAVFRRQPILFGCALAGLTLVPLVLMRRHLHLPWAQSYCAEACITVATTGAMCYFFGGGGDLSWVQPLRGLLTAVAVGLALVMVPLIGGTTLSAMFQSLVTGPASLGDVFFIPLKVPHCYWSAILSLICAGAVLARRRSLGEHQWLGMVAKGAFGAIGAFWFLGYYKWQLAFLWPWIWVALIPTVGTGSLKTGAGFGRAALCSLAAWEALQAYPTAGTQSVVGTMLMVPLFALCLHDAIVAAARLPAVALRLKTVGPRAACLVQALAVVAVIYLFVTRWCNPVSARRYYASVPSTGLRGAERVHLPETESAPYRAIAAYLKTACDTFITIPGLNSLYIWTGKAPPTYFNVSEVVLQTDQEQHMITDALLRSPRPVVVLSTRPGAQSPGEGPLGLFIRDRFKVVQKIDSFLVLAPAEPSATPAQAHQSDPAPTR